VVCVGSKVPVRACGGTGVPARWLSSAFAMTPKELQDRTLVFMRAAGIAPDRAADVLSLSAEADELARIFAASYRTSKRKQEQARKEKRRRG